MIPYLASAEWWMAEEPKMAQRHLMRCRIRGRDGSPLLLSVPVIGGASALKHADPTTWVISDHDHWNLKHRHALETAYSRTPFFSHFYPALEAILAAPPEMATELCRRCERWVIEALDMEQMSDELAEFRLRHPERSQSIKENLICKIRPELSIADALFRLGRDLVFVL